MISMNCSCGGDFWIRDRLAGRTTNCPECGTTLAVPPIETVKTIMTAAVCTCGEVFWSLKWHPGRLSKCPFCDRVVGPPGSKNKITVVNPSEAKTTIGPVARPPDSQAEEEPPRGSNPNGKPSQKATATRAEARRPPLDLGKSTQALALAVGAAALLTAGIIVGARSGVRTPQAGNVSPIDSAARGARVEDAKGAVADNDPPASPAQPDLSAPLRVLVPAYFYPTGPGLGDWNRLIEAAVRVPIVAVMNPASGPGETPIPDYADVVRRAKAAGITVIGYVNTEYAKRPGPEVFRDVDRWAQFYPIQGIFFDAQSSEAKHADFYAELRDHVRKKFGKALVITNPGTVCDEDYFARSITDVAVLFEFQKGFEDFTLPPWAYHHNARRVAALPYSVATPERMKETVRQAVLKGVGYLYVTDGDGPNPWNRLPRYWVEEVDAVKRVNERRPQ